MNRKLFLLFIFNFILSINILSAREMLFSDMQMIIENINIDFTLFPTTNTWNGNNALPILNTRNKRKQSAEILEAAKQEPNFNGKYRIVEFESRPGWRHFFIIDLNNGLVYEIFLWDFYGVKYTKESSLIILNPIEVLPYENDEYISIGPTYMHWNGQDLEFLIFINDSAGINIDRRQKILFSKIRNVAENVNIDFLLFPTQNVWDGNSPIPIINTREKRENRSLIMEAAKLEPNFNGKYRIVEFKDRWGWLQFFIINLNNGLVYETFMRDIYGIKFTKYSSMILINPIESLPYEDDDHIFVGPVYKNWNAQNLDFLLSVNAHRGFL